MLSKSQARIFFFGGTALFSLVFLFLTVDTIRQVPSQTRENEMTDAVKRGKLIWDKNNCMGCHTLLGEGAYYAPELTKVVERRGEMWIKLFLRDPQAMFPNERKMIQYNFKPQQINDLVAFFRWIGKMDLNGFPAKPSLRPPAPTPKTPKTSPARPRSQVQRRQKQAQVLRAKVPVSLPTTRKSPKAPTSRAQSVVKAVARPAHFAICSACHMVGGVGGKVGPALDGVGKKYSKSYLKKWLTDPQAVKPGTKMPKLPLNPAQLHELVEYLYSLR